MWNCIVSCVQEIVLYGIREFWYQQIVRYNARFMYSIRIHSMYKGVLNVLSP